MKEKKQRKKLPDDADHQHLTTEKKEAYVAIWLSVMLHDNSVHI